MSSMSRILNPAQHSRFTKIDPIGNEVNRFHERLTGQAKPTIVGAPQQAPAQTGEDIARSRTARPRGAKASVLSAANRSSLIGY